MRGLSNRDGAAIVTARAGRPFRSIEDLWQRAAVPLAALERLAAADAFRPSLGLSRRAALWAIRALHERPLPLFEAASERAGEPVPEIPEPAVALQPMTAGREVVEDYGALGLSLRSHPVAFLRRDLAARQIIPCAEVGLARDGRHLATAGLVLVRQRPGSANGVLFLTIEDETGVANIIVWPDLFERQRRVILSAGIIAVRGRVQREGEVVHVIARKLTDLSELLRSLGERDEVFPPQGRKGPAGQAGGPDPRKTPGRKPQDAPVSDSRPGPEIKVPTRDFR